MPTPAPATCFNVFLDSDGPVANFDKALQASGADTEDFKFWPGVYLWLEETPGARNAIDDLKRWDDMGLIRVFIATKTPSHSPYAYTEKVLWYRQHFPWLEDRVILTHDKSVLGRPGDFLTDDRPHKGNVQHFKGTFHLFDVVHPEKSWEDFLNLIENRLAVVGGREA